MGKENQKPKIARDANRQEGFQNEPDRAQKVGIRYHSEIEHQMHLKLSLCQTKAVNTNVQQ